MPSAISTNVIIHHVWVIRNGFYSIDPHWQNSPPPRLPTSSPECKMINCLVAVSRLTSSERREERRLLKFTKWTFSGNFRRRWRGGGHREEVSLTLVWPFPMLPRRLGKWHSLERRLGRELFLTEHAWLPEACPKEDSLVFENCE